MFEFLEKIWIFVCGASVATVAGSIAAYVAFSVFKEIFR
jgi:hypothetical protein